MKTVTGIPSSAMPPAAASLQSSSVSPPQPCGVGGQEAQACCSLGQALHLSIPSIKAILRGSLCSVLSSSSASKGLLQVISVSPWRAGKPDTWQAKARRQDPGFRKLFMELWQGVRLPGLLLLKIWVTHCLSDGFQSACAVQVSQTEGPEEVVPGFVPGLNPPPRLEDRDL